jgi:lipoate-protein ligase A
VKENGINVIRRISGGGTVFHDLGNLNFTFIQNGEKGKLVDFQKFTDPILAVLNEMGVPAVFEGKNDLRVNGLKISGNAEHVFKNRVLHHGTLLFSSGLNDLGKALKVKTDRFTDKAVKSNRSIVANISDFLEKPMEIEEFRNRIIKHVYKENNSGFYKMTAEDIWEIEELKEEKYTSWKWNFGYSPNYSFSGFIPVNKEKIGFSVHVVKGLVSELRVPENEPESKLIELISQQITGSPHEESSIRDRLEMINDELGEMGFSPEEVSNYLF